ncbi:site-specific integrase [Streptomyces sp. NBC_01462]|nr:DUF6300 family protein [Streptomyces sp. NBC_01462]
MPVDFLVVQAFDLYAVERHEWLGSGGSDHCLVNLFRPPYGAPITTGAIGELLESLSRRAGLGRVVTPRMCRHAMASNVTDAGGSLDEVQALLGQKHPGTPRPYLHPATARLRAAVDQDGTVSGFRESVLCRVCDRAYSAAAPLIALCEEDGSFPADKLDVFGPLAEVWVEDRRNTAVDEGLLNEQERLWRNGELWLASASPCGPTHAGGPGRRTSSLTRGRQCLLSDRLPQRSRRTVPNGHMV